MADFSGLKANSSCHKDLEGEQNKVPMHIDKRLAYWSARTIMGGKLQHGGS